MNNTQDCVTLYTEEGEAMEVFKEIADRYHLKDGEIMINRIFYQILSEHMLLSLETAELNLAIATFNADHRFVAPG